MTTITIVPHRSEAGADYRAVAGRRQSVGKTPGEALDAMTAQLPSDESGTLVVVQSLRPDAYFTAEQVRRLDELMMQWRAARDRGTAISPADQAELDALVKAELDAATRRAEALADGLSS
jgi:hypothetical protein